LGTNAEAIGQLLATSALMDGERELLRKQGDRPAETAAPPAPQKAGPISHDSKAVATVLLTLLDEQLHATETASAALKAANPADGGDGASKQVAARYATDGLIPSDDSSLPEPMIASDQARLRDMQPTVSADLQTFMQRFAAIAAGQPRDADKNMRVAKGFVSTLSALVNRTSPLGFASVAAMLLWLLMLIIQRLAP
jgi:hypothetical protein